MTLHSPEVEIKIRRAGGKTIYRAVNTNVWTYVIAEAINHGTRKLEEGGKACPGSSQQFSSSSRSSAS